MKKSLLFFISAIACFPVFAQNQFDGYDFIANLKNDASIGKIDFYVKTVDPCAVNSEKNYYGIESSISNTSTSGFLNFKVQVTDCEGKIYEQSISILLSKLQRGFNNNNIYWELIGKLSTPPYQITISNSYNNTKPIQKGEVKLIDPDSLIISNNDNNIIAYGDKVIMEIAGGDNLINSTNTYWSWHIGSLNSKEFITQDKNYIFTPTSNTIVYVTAVKKTSTGFIRSKTVSKTIYVDTKSYEPYSITADNTSICSSSNGANLSINGGLLGKMAKWVWYKNGCGEDGGEIVAKGVTNLQVSPNVTTTYYVRAEGDENYTNCKAVTIEVVDPPKKPLIQLIGKNEICQGETVKLILPGQPVKNYDNSQWIWYQKDITESNYNMGSTNKLNLSGTAILTNPIKSSNFYVISEGGICNSVSSEVIKVVVKTKSSNTVIKTEPIQNSHKFILSANTNDLGTNAKWMWYEGKYRNETNPLSSNLTKLSNQEAIIEIKSEKKEDKYIYISAQGDCDIPPTINGSITIPKYQEEVVVVSKTNNTRKIKNSYPKANTRNIVKKSLGPVKKQFILNVGQTITDDKKLNTFIYTLGATGLEGNSSGNYIKYMKTDVNIYPTGDLVADNPTQTILNYPNDGTYYKFNNVVKTFIVQSYILGTMTTDFNQSVTIYSGFGYGEVKTIWGYDKYSKSTNKFLSSGFAKNNAKSYGGLALELGLMLRIRCININGGVSSVFGLSEVRDQRIQPTAADPYADRVLSFEKFIKGHIGIGISILSRK
jgi:hypothetical protein